MTAELTKCLNPECGHDKALTHYSSGGEVNWVACPKCEKFFVFGKEKEEKDAQFWKQVREDTGYNPVIVSINPPPSDKRCVCCNRHVSEVKPFGKAGDPLVGDFDGVLLLKNFRAMCPHNVDADAKIKAVIDELKSQGKASPYEDFEALCIEKYGKEETEQLMGYDELVSMVSASWECRDCFILSDKEYYDKKYERRMRMM